MAWKKDACEQLKRVERRIDLFLTIQVSGF
jgi:hypothetical protein